MTRTVIHQSDQIPQTPKQSKLVFRNRGKQLVWINPRHTPMKTTLSDPVIPGWNGIRGCFQRFYVQSFFPIFPIFPFVPFFSSLSRRRDRYPLRCTRFIHAAMKITMLMGTKLVVNQPCGGRRRKYKTIILTKY